MSRMSYGELKDRRRAMEKTRRDERHRKKTELKPKADKIRAQIQYYVKTCGLTTRQISQFSGLEFSTVDKFIRGYNKSVNIHMLSALATVAGYEIKVVPIDPHNDKYRQERRLPPEPLEK